MLLTTTVGSFPKPDYLLEARRKADAGNLDESELHALEKRATQECLALQEEVGLDVLVHGEMERGDMATYFAQHLQGFAISGLVRAYGNRWYRKPIVVGDLRRAQPITVEMWDFAQALTDKPVKGMLTGPYTMMDWSFVEHYPDRRSCCLALAEAIHEEAAELDRAGAQYVQIDEPAVSTRPDEIDLAIEAMGVVTDGLKAKTITHICYGDFERIYPRMLDIPVTQIDLELANDNFEMLELFKTHPFTKEIGLGVIDVHSHEVENEEQVLHGIREAAKIIPPERIYVDPDCGLKTRTAEQAKAKLQVMISAVKKASEELAAGASG